MAYKYDPILRMNVPANVNDEKTVDKEDEQKAWTVEYQLNGIRVTHSIGVVAESADDAIKKAEKYLSKMGWAHIFGAKQKESLENMKRRGRTIIDEKTWDNAIQAADASRIIEQKNGYTLGINSQGTICLAFPGETIDNPHMYLGKENEKNLADAKAMFKEFSNLRGK